MLVYQRVYRFSLALLDLRGAGVEELRRSATFMARRGNAVSLSKKMVGKQK